MRPFMADYFLHIDLIVPANKSNDFESKVREFLSKGGFKRLDPANDYRLSLALKTPLPFTNSRFNPVDSDPVYKDPGRVRRVAGTEQLDKEKVFRYVHLWHLPDTRDLDVASVMNAAADDRIYTELDALVAREVQNLVVRIRWPGDPQGLPPVPRQGKFVRVMRQFRTSDLGTYLFNVPAILPTLQRAGWNSFGHYENATGLLNTFTEFWHTNIQGANPRPDAMTAALRTAADEARLARQKELGYSVGSELRTDREIAKFRTAADEAQRLWEETLKLEPSEDREILERYM